jgi:hypothetical protein
MIRVTPVDVANRKLEEPFCVRLSSARTVGDLKKLIADKLQIPTADNMRCVMERYYCAMKSLDKDDRTLQSEGFQKTNKVWPFYILMKAVIGVFVDRMW